MRLAIRDEELPRAWSEEGRALPYICDVFDAAISGCVPDDIVIYTNADICVSLDCCARVEKCLESAEACYAYRRDFKSLSVPLSCPRRKPGEN